MVVEAHGQSMLNVRAGDVDWTSESKHAAAILSLKEPPSPKLV